MKEVEPSESEDGGSEVAEEIEEHDDDDTETLPAVKPYNALLLSFQPPTQQNGRSRKRRKLAPREEAMEVDDVASIDQDDGLEVSDESEGVTAREEVEEGGAANGQASEAEDVVGEEEDLSDPFETHFADPDDNELSRRLQAVQANQWRTEKHSVSNIGNVAVSVPKCLQSSDSMLRRPATKKSQDLPLKNRLVAPADKLIGSFDGIQQAVLPYMSTYTDVLVGNRTPRNAGSLRRIACLHAINHVLKGRDRVIRNNARLAHSDEDLELRDQGFTRPKVLILLETRHMCAKYADTIVTLFTPEQQENKQRFQDSFSAPINDDHSTMPEDYLELFVGNKDNNFLTALKFTRKTLRFYSPFYGADIILASPLGLRRIIENEDAKKRDRDFLSSIEIVIVDQADAMRMQSWENVEKVFQNLNAQVKDAHGCDFSRVRHWYLDRNAKYLRQTIVFSAYMTPEINRLFNISMLNVAGKAKLTPVYNSGAISSLGGLGGIKQTFSRFASPSPAADPDARFQHFTTAILPSLLRLPKPIGSDGSASGHGILIFVPTYYDFLRLRNFFATSGLTANISFGSINEYSDVSAQRRARAHFLSGRHSVLLYTQRAHHFFRLRIRGVRRVVLYGLPDNATFYEELVDEYLETSLSEGRLREGEGSMRCLFSRWDGLALERVVGTGRVKGMLGGGMGDTFEFV